jgi:hypothetical protein
MRELLRATVNGRKTLNSDYGRTVEYAARASVRVEFFTTHYHVSGDVQLSRWRLADLLNDPTQDFIVMESAIREPLTEPGQPSGAEQARASEFLQLTKRSIVLAIPHASIEFDAARQQLLSTLQAEPRHLVAT